MKPPILGGMFARGESRPEWCFLAVQDGQPCATIGFHGDIQAPQLVRVFAMSGAADTLVALLEKALAAMQAQGSKSILAETGREETQSSLQRAGFERLQNRMRWRWENPWPAVPIPSNFTFRNMESIGETAFTGLIETIFQRTHDPRLRLEARVWGSGLAAEKTIENLKTRNAHADWWQVCSRPDGTPIGLVCPYLEAPRTGTFGLLETFPWQDGGRKISTTAPSLELAGPGQALLAKGTAILQARGVDEIFYAAPENWSQAFSQIGEYTSGGNLQMLLLEF